MTEQDYIKVSDHTKLKIVNMILRDLDIKTNNMISIHEQEDIRILTADIRNIIERIANVISADLQNN
jgi:hypothetical protein